MLLGGGLYAGATLVIMEAFDLERSLMLAQQYGVTLYYAVPPILVALDNSARVTQYTFRACATSWWEPHRWHPTWRSGCRRKCRSLCCRGTD